ncbi:MAG: ABC transporter ATP-binding protein [Chloroflexi bacterium]|nr:ABC transporter ATP-binding protein [Chloroflexota bacterium]
MHPTPVIQTRALTRRFGRITAVDQLDFQVEPGITYGLLGPNGSGKTTLIRLLLGILPATAGEAHVLGRRVPDRSVRAQTGYMPQATALYEDLTVRENVSFYARLHDAASASHISQAVGLVGLTERADDQVFTLSGGLKRRLSLACALVHGPALLFLDEPTVGVDPQLRVQFWEHFRSLNQQGVTILVSTHVMDEAERCHRLGLLQDGRLLAEGSAQELRQRSGKATLEEAFLRFAEGHGNEGIPP